MGQSVPEVHLSLYNHTKEGFCKEAGKLEETVILTYRGYGDSTIQNKGKINTYGSLFLLPSC